MVRFSESTQFAGISFLGESYGAAWGYYDDDQFPDLWVANHHDEPSLYRNNGDGTFTDVVDTALVDPLHSDPHGSAWADIDNDGDQDLIQLFGGAFGNPRAFTDPDFFNQLFVNESGQLEDQADVLGVEVPGGRGRTPQFADLNNDGRLDLIVTNSTRDTQDLSAEEQPPTTIFLQTESGTFEEAREEAGLDFTDSRRVLLADITNDRNLDLVFPFERGYDTRTFPFQDVSSVLSSAPRSRDTAIGDLNGDLQMDFYLAREQVNSDITQRSSKELLSILRGSGDNGNAPGFSFRTQGNRITLLFRRPRPTQFNLDSRDIFIGSEGFHPRDGDFRANSTTYRLTLSPDDRRVRGIRRRGSRRGIYIGYDRDLSRWQVFWNSRDATSEDDSSDNAGFQQLVVQTRSSQRIGNVRAQNFSVDPARGNDQLLLSSPEGYVVRNLTEVNTLPNQSSSVLLEDFDNDTDLDAYVVTTGAIANRPNRFYENLGDGTFRIVPNAGGAAGSQQGLGEAAVSADYNNDGFIDVFVTNGRNTAGPWFHRDFSPSQLFTNEGNDNHWTLIDLEGTISNRDGVGTTVYATAGGKTQIRAQAGGIHLFSQNHQRLHFGLGESTVIDELEFFWPSGIVQTLRNIPADQILTVKEGVGGAGNDTILSRPPNRSSVEFLGLGGNDRLAGGPGDDRLIGGSGRDNLVGRAGDDLLNGGAGPDRLVTGGGSDIVLFESRNHGRDRIQDFSVSSDLIQIQRQGFQGSLELGQLRNRRFTLGNRAQDSQDRFIYNRSSGQLWFDADGDGSTSQILLAEFTNRPNLRAGNISVI